MVLCALLSALNGTSPFMLTKSNARRVQFGRAGVHLEERTPWPPRRAVLPARAHIGHVQLNNFATAEWFTAERSPAAHLPFRGAVFNKRPALFLQRARALHGATTRRVAADWHFARWNIRGEISGHTLKNSCAQLYKGEEEKKCGNWDEELFPECINHWCVYRTFVRSTITFDGNYETAHYTGNNNYSSYRCSITQCKQSHK